MRTFYGNSIDKVSQNAYTIYAGSHTLYTRITEFALSAIDWHRLRGRHKAVFFCEKISSFNCTQNVLYSF